MVGPASVAALPVHCRQKFLKAYYPVLKGTARFFLDFLTEHPSYKWWVVAPSVSPEHGPVTAGCTMDNQIVFDALYNTLQASEIVGDDAAFRDSLAQMLDRLPPMQVGRHGQLQEWLQDVDDPKDEHRHISHLYGLYPSNQVSPFRTPDFSGLPVLRWSSVATRLRGGASGGR